MEKNVIVVATKNVGRSMLCTTMMTSMKKFVLALAVLGGAVVITRNPETWSSTQAGSRRFPVRMSLKGQQRSKWRQRSALLRVEPSCLAAVKPVIGYGTLQWLCAATPLAMDATERDWPNPPFANTTAGGDG
jgi:hypothetical protein